MQICCELQMLRNTGAVGVSMFFSQSQRTADSDSECCPGKDLNEMSAVRDKERGKQGNGGVNFII